MPRQMNTQGSRVCWMLTRSIRRQGALMAVLLSAGWCATVHAGSTDCNNNGIEDAVEIANGTSTDCNADGVLDECESGVAFRPYTVPISFFSQDTLATAIDVNGDGNFDVAVRNRSPATLVFLENPEGNGPTDRGALIFPPGQISASASGLTAGDIDGDGDQDLVVDGVPTIGLGWYENLDGVGGEWGVRQISDQFFLSEVTLVDFDGDGDLDIIAGGAWISGLSLFLNEGDGDFAAPITIVENTFVSDFTCADLDSDGDLDIALTRTGLDSLGWIRYDSTTNSFGTVESISTSTLIIDQGIVAVGDVDNDNDIDLVVGRAGSATLAVIENTNGAGDFLLGQQLFSPNASVADVELVDLNGDNYLDLLIGSFSTSFSPDPLVWHLNTAGAETFSTASESQPFATTSIQRIELADINGDGNTDVLATVTSPNSPIVFFASSRDCDGNGINDSCEIDDGTASDCDGNGIPDICDAVVEDCNSNQIPDWCEEDCDSNGVINDCEPFVSFVEYVIDQGIDDVFGIDVGDIDGDGDPDLIAAVINEDRVIWYANNDDGTFDNPLDVAVGLDGASHVKLIDIDHDTWLDAVIAASEAGTIGWHRNENGNGFGPRQELSGVTFEYGDLGIADMDGDNDFDVIVASGPTGVVGWSENLDGSAGLGRFQVVEVLPGTARAVAAGDIDGDGDNDLVMSDYDNESATWHANIDGQGNWGPAQLITNASLQVVDIEIFDMDDDGDADVLLSQQGSFTGSERNPWLMNLDGIGASWSRRRLPIDFDPTSGTFDSAVADLTGDGELDVTRFTFDGMAWASRLNRPGNRWVRLESRLTPTARFASEIIPCDIDADGDIDLVYTATKDNAIAVMLNVDGDCDNDGVPDLCQRDCDRDGRVDICEITEKPSLDCDGDEQLDACQTSPRFAKRFEDESELQFNKIAIGDIDDDGLTDVLAAPPATATDQADLYLIRNLGEAPGFASATALADTGDKPSALQLADIDNDGDLDAVTLSAGSGSIMWYPNINGLGTFAFPTLIAIGLNNPSELVAADIDGDHDVDLVVTNSGSNDVLWFENTNPTLGSFSTANMIDSRAETPDQLVAADFDGDHDIDIAVSYSGDLGLLWYRNTDGAGDFSAGPSIPSVDVPVSDLRAVDLDVDGDMDLLASSVVTENIVWYENQAGVGNFGEYRLVTNSNEPPTVVNHVDADNDGEPDVIVIRDYLGIRAELFWFENQGAAVSFRSNSGRVGTNFNGLPIAIEVADADGDGDDDVFLALPTELQLIINDSNDCNGNGIPDSCEQDSDGNGVIDACELLIGDVNCDGLVNLADIPAFSLALVDRLAYVAEFGPCTADRADIDDDGDLNGNDVVEFTANLTMP